MSAGTEPVEVWLVDLARAAPNLAAEEAAHPRLSTDELDRAAAMGESGEDWRLSRIALRIVLERVVGSQLREQPFRLSSRGKPALPWDAGIEFSLSHTGQYALIAVARKAVGVDLEQVRPVRFPPDRQQAMLDAARALVGSGPIDFLQAWVRLEAWAKARGSGVGALLHDISIRGPGWEAHTAQNFGAIAAERLRAEGFTIQDLDLPAPFHGAIAINASRVHLHLRHFPAHMGSIDDLEAPPAALLAKSAG